MEPKIWVWVIIFKNNFVLLGKRKNSHGEGTWSFPWWHLEFWESWENCAKREVKEETNLDISDIQYFHTTNDIFKKEKKHYNTIFMKSNNFQWELTTMEPHKCLEWKWFDKNNLPENIFLPIKNLLKEKQL